MACVVAEPCFGCKHTTCVDVCPVPECFREGESMLYIDPDLCKDCETCIKACPENAIFRENELPEEWIPYKELNAEMAKQCPQFERKAG